MFRTDYFLYMAEKEGLNHIVNTRQARLNAAINEFESFSVTVNVEPLIFSFPL